MLLISKYVCVTQIFSLTRRRMSHKNVGNLDFAQISGALFFKFILLCRVLPGSQFDDYTQKYKQDMYHR